MTRIRVMAIFQGGSGLPEDRFINTFHFWNIDPIGDYAVNAEAALERVDNFYTGSADGEAPVGQFLSPWVERDFLMQAYNLELPAGEREPEIRSAILPATTSDGLPEECAITLTLWGAPPVTARRRGRIYIGPLADTSTVWVPGSTGAQARPNVGTSGTITASLKRSAALLSGETPGGFWAIRSTTPTENFVIVRAGYVDNAFDTQRRRGPDPSFREYFVNPLGPS